MNAGSEDLAWHLKLEAGRRGVAGGDEEKRQRSAGVVKGMEQTGGPHMAVT
jgi:hypothetical protein